MAGGLSIPFDVKAQSDLGADAKVYDDVLAGLRGRMAALDDPGRKSAAFWAAAGQPTRGGSLAESLSNGALTQAQAQREDDKLKAGYMPLMMQAIQASQMAQMQKAALAEQRKRDAIWQQEMQPRLGMGAGLDPSMLPPENRISGQQLQPIGSDQGGLRGKPLSYAMALAARTGRKESDVLALWKQENEGIVREPGKAYQMGDGSWVMGPVAVDKGQQSVPDGRGGWTVRNAPNAVAANTEMALSSKLADVLATQTGKVTEVKGANGITSFVPDSQINTGPSDALRNLLRAGEKLEPSRQLGAPQPIQGQGIPSVGAYQPSTQDRAAIEADAQKNGVQAPFINFSQKPSQPPQIQQPSGLRRDANGNVIGGQTDAEKNADAANKAFHEKTASHDAERLKGYAASAEAAGNSIASVYNMREAEKRGVFSGGGANAKTAASSFIQGITGFTPQSLPGSQEFNMEANKLVLEHIKSLGANPSNADREFIEKTVPTLSTDPEARNRLLDRIEGMAKGTIQFYKTADTYAREKGGLGGFHNLPPAGPVVKTGTKDGRKVYQYANGSIVYAD